MSQPTRNEWIGVAGLTLMMILLTSLSTPFMSPLGFEADGARYAAMAKPELFEPGVGEIAPWCWRPLTPFLAAQLPIPTRESFRVLGTVCNFVSLLLLFAILRGVGVSFRAGCVGVVLYGGIFWTLKFSAYSPGYIDFMTQTFLLTILYATLTGRYWLVPFVLAIGVVQKESLLLVGLVPILEFARRHPEPRRWVAYLVATLAPALVAIAIVRVSIMPANDYSSLTSLLRHLDKLAQPDIALRLLLATLSGLGVAFVLPFFTRASSRRALRDQPMLSSLLAIGLVMLFGGADKARLFLYMAPAVVVLAAMSLDILLTRWDRTAWLWLVATLALHLGIGHHFTPMGTRFEYLSRMVPMHARGSDYLVNLAWLSAFVVIWVVGTGSLIRSGKLGPAPDASA